ncbi:MAG: YdbL family protein [Alphaproteobacteria bacterium]|nr:YdbL family protein [Alphaproteobacteria bacterium]
MKIHFYKKFNQIAFSWLSIFTVLLFCLFTINSSYAQSLDDAKAAGLIGEKNDGFVGAVKQPADAKITSLIETINAKRQKAYQDIAGKQNVPVEQVGALAAEKIYKEAPAGTYLWQNGSWVKK